MLYTEDKPYSVKFDLDYKILTILYMCYKYKFPLCLMLTLYERYGETSLFIFKALSCTKKLALSDTAFLKIVEQSKVLYKQIIAGISTNMKITQLSAIVKNGGRIKEPIPEAPVIDIKAFKDDYKTFVSTYLLPNIVDIFNYQLELKFNTADVYNELKP